MCIFVEIQDIFGNKLSLPEGRINHIKEKHPEIYVSSIKDSLSEPDYVIVSSVDKSIKIYYKKKGKYYIVVVINLSKKLVITSFTSDKIKKGEIEWTKN